MKRFKKVVGPEVKNLVFLAREIEVVKLAFGVTIGGAVLKLITSFVTNIVNPLVAILTGKIDFNDLTFHVLGAKLRIGTFISSTIDFAIVVLVIYFAIKKLGVQKLIKAPEENTGNN